MARLIFSIGCICSQINHSHPPTLQGNLQPGRHARSLSNHTATVRSLPYGGFVSPEGNSFTSRALPEDNKNKPYNAYEITSPIEAEAGPTIPWFGEEGMGTRYELPKNINTLKSEGNIRVVNQKNSSGDL